MTQRRITDDLPALFDVLPDVYIDPVKENNNLDDLLEIINPVISQEQGTIVYQEGCLSVPSFYEDIERYEKLTLNYQDRHGNQQSLEAEGLLSVAIQHEIDHLDGKLFIEKLSYMRRKKFEKEYKRLQKSKKQAS